MKLTNYLIEQKLLDKIELHAQYLTNLILVLVDISKQAVETNDEIVYEVKAKPSNAYVLDKTESKVIDGCSIGQLFSEELYKTERSVLEKALAQICGHAKKIEIRISTQDKIHLKNLEYVVLKS